MATEGCNEIWPENRRKKTNIWKRISRVSGKEGDNSQTQCNIWISSAWWADPFVLNNLAVNVWYQLAAARTTFRDFWKIFQKSRSQKRMCNGLLWIALWPQMKCELKMLETFWSCCIKKSRELRSLTRKCMTCWTWSMIVEVLDLKYGQVEEIVQKCDWNDIIRPQSPKCKVCI